LNVTENLVVSGNLTVSGTTTTVNTETVNIADNIIVLNSNYAGSSPTENGGITIERGTKPNYSFLFDETNNRWTVADRNMVANTFIGALTGNASTATGLASAVTVQLTGDITGSATFTNGGDTASITTTYNNDVVLGTDTSGNYVGTITAGDGIDTSGASSGEGIAHSISLEKASTSNLGGAIFNSNNFVVDSNGLASIKPSGIELGTETSGNYVATVGVGTGLDVSGSGSESAAVTVSLDLSELSTSTSDGDGDFFVVVDSSNVQRKLTKANVNLSGFNNDGGFVTTGKSIAMSIVFG